MTNFQRLTAAGFVQEFSPLDNGLFIQPNEKRAASPSILNASSEEADDFIEDKRVVLWGISDPTAQTVILRRIGR